MVIAGEYDEDQVADGSRDAGLLKHALELFPRACGVRWHMEMQTGAQASGLRSEVAHGDADRGPGTLAVGGQGAVGPAGRCTTGAPPLPTYCPAGVIKSPVHRAARLEATPFTCRVQLSSSTLGFGLTLCLSTWGRVHPPHLDVLRLQCGQTTQMPCVFRK